jgi:hypothetical protein
VSYRIFNLQGSLVLEGEINESQINIKSLQIGQYLLEAISNSGKRLTAKITKL